LCGRLQETIRSRDEQLRYVAALQRSLNASRELAEQERENHQRQLQQVQTRMANAPAAAASDRRPNDGELADALRREQAHVVQLVADMEAAAQLHQRQLLRMQSEWRGSEQEERAAAAYEKQQQLERQSEATAALQREHTALVQELRTRVAQAHVSEEQLRSRVQMLEQLLRESQEQTAYRRDRVESLGRAVQQECRTLRSVLHDVRAVVAEESRGYLNEELKRVSERLVRLPVG
jgi:hypothetical protein